MTNQGHLSTLSIETTRGLLKDVILDCSKTIVLWLALIQSMSSRDYFSRHRHTPKVLFCHPGKADINLISTRKYAKYITGMPQKNTKLILVWVWSCLGFLYLFRNKFLKTRERLCLSAVLKFEAFIAVRPVPNLASKSSASAFLLLFSSITLGDIALSQKRIFDFSIHQLKITLIIFRGEENYM